VVLVAVAGGLGLLDLSSCANVEKVSINNPANNRLKFFVFILLFG
jgi:hypothetical protein